MRVGAVCGVVVVGLAWIAGGTPAMAQDPGLRRAAQLTAAWRELRPKATGPLFAEAPLVAAPYAPGRLNEAYLRDGLNALRFIRLVAGVPDDVTLDPERSLNAQYGAVLLARLNTLAHSPSRPPDMPSAFFERGRRACGLSNLALGAANPAEAMRLFMDDTGVTSLGHRRWLMNWRLQQVGIGFAQGQSRITVVEIFDTSRPKGEVAPFVAWPAVVAFPVEWVGARMDWSVDLAPASFDPPDPARLRVTVVRERDDQRWTLRLGEGLRATPDGYGNGRGLAFRPPVLPKDGERWRVEVEGLRRRDGSTGNLVYSTSFFRLGP